MGATWSASAYQWPGRAQEGPRGATTSNDRAVDATERPFADRKLHLQLLIAAGPGGPSVGQGQTHWLPVSGDGINSHVRMKDAGCGTRYRSHTLTVTLITASPTALLHCTRPRVYSHLSVRVSLFPDPPSLALLFLGCFLRPIRDPTMCHCNSDDICP